MITVKLVPTQVNELFHFTGLPVSNGFYLIKFYRIYLQFSGLPRRTKWNPQNQCRPAYFHIPYQTLRHGARAHFNYTKKWLLWKGYERSFKSGPAPPCPLSRTLYPLRRIPSRCGTWDWKLIWGWIHICSSCQSLWVERIRMKYEEQ